MWLLEGLRSPVVGWRHRVLDMRAPSEAEGWLPERRHTLFINSPWKWHPITLIVICLLCCNNWKLLVWSELVRPTYTRGRRIHNGTKVRGENCWELWCRMPSMWVNKGRGKSWWWDWLEKLKEKRIWWKPMTERKEKGKEDSKILKMGREIWKARVFTYTLPSLC